MCTWSQRSTSPFRVIISHCLCGDLHVLKFIYIVSMIDEMLVAPNCKSNELSPRELEASGDTGVQCFNPHSEVRSEKLGVDMRRVGRIVFVGGYTVMYLYNGSILTLHICIGVT